MPFLFFDTDLYGLVQMNSVFPFLPRHYHMTHVLLLPFITTVWTPVVLAILNITYATFKMFMMMMTTMVTRRRFSSVGRAPTSATEPSVQLDLASATIC